MFLNVVKYSALCLCIILINLMVSPLFLCVYSLVVCVCETKVACTEVRSGVLCACMTSVELHVHFIYSLSINITTCGNKWLVPSLGL